MQINHLFVYGTLLAVADHPMGRVLHRAGRKIGTGWFHGRLYIIDDPEEPGNRYPGAVPSGYEDDRVFGELWELDDPAGQLAEFDVYEACDPSRPAPHEFLRRTIPVTLSDGAVVQSVCYLYAWDTSRATLIPDGRFREALPDAR